MTRALRALVFIITLILVGLVLGANLAQAAPTGPAAKRIMGTPRSGHTWHTGVWTGAPFTLGHVQQFEKWRGRKVDVVTAYSERGQGWDGLKNNSWSIDIYKDFPGRLNYGLAPIPNGVASDMAGRKRIMAAIARGEKDDVYRGVARNLKRARHGDATIRLAWEPTAISWQHGADSTNAKEYRAMWNHIAAVMERESGHFRFDWSLICGQSVRDTKGRLDAFELLYPGDRYVDIVGCSQYDWWGQTVKSGDPSGLLRPPRGPGVADMAKFARAHRKGLGLGEWGLSADDGNGGGGDNPYYIREMRLFLWANRDIVVYEAYFDDNTPTNHHRISENQFPKAAVVYKRYW